MVRLDHQALLAAALRSDLGTFIARTFLTVSPGNEYLTNWHIDAIVYQLMEIHSGRNKRLIITQPPRSLKSICTSVAFVAWAVGHNPAQKFACVSYSSELAAEFSRQFRRVISSRWYKDLFPNVYFTKETESECVTTKGGGRYAVSVGGSFTGRGADIIIIDDPLKADDAQSDKSRTAVNDWFANTLISRLDNKEKGAIVLVMQRLHEDDLAGTLLREGGWQHLDLPAIAVEDQNIQTGPEAYHHRKQGDALHPARESLDTLMQIKSGMGSLVFSAQYQQRPVPLEGNLVRREWIQWYEKLPNDVRGQIVQSWDTATSTGNANDYSVCTTWFILNRNYYLIDVWRGRLEYPQLKRKIVELAGIHNPRRILIEKIGAGEHLAQEFRQNPVPKIPVPIGIKPEGCKEVRMEAQSATFESGRVFLPHEVPWLATFLSELMGFPNTRHDDQVDSVSQFLNWAERRGRRRRRVATVPPELIFLD